MADEWGEWIEHDGKGCPAVGFYTQIASKGGVIATGIPSPQCDRPNPGCWSAWVWSSIPDDWTHFAVIRYRTRKPRGMAILQQLVADPPPLVETDDPAPVAAG